MYEDDKFETYSENINNETNEVRATDADMQESAASAQPQAEQVNMQESIASAQLQAAEVNAQESATSAQPQAGAQDSAQQGGSFSGHIAQQTTQPAWTCVEPQPRKKQKNHHGWIKKAVAMVVCGVVLGGSAAGTFYGVTWALQGTEVVEETGHTAEAVKNPEISKVEPITVIPTETGTNGSVTVMSYDVSDVVESVMPAMVSVVNRYTETVSSFWGQSYTQQGASSGSGIIIGENDTELLIATNDHVVSGSDSIEITFKDGSTADAYIKGTDSARDLAVVCVLLDDLTAETKNAIAVASLGNSDDLKMGQPVIAIGNALGYGQSVTTGVVSATDREISSEDGTASTFIQTDAAINPGNSGGALLNLQGQVIGINSSKIGGSTVEGMGFAIPISAAEPIISDLSLQTTKIKVAEENRGYMGISIREVTASTSNMYGMPQGVFVAELVEGGAAEQAGIKVRDIIVKFDSFEIGSYADLQEALQYYAAGDTATVTVMRISENGEYKSVPLELTLGVKPAE